MNREDLVTPRDIAVTPEELIIFFKKRCSETCEEIENIRQEIGGLSQDIASFSQHFKSVFDDVDRKLDNTEKAMIRLGEGLTRINRTRISLSGTGISPYQEDLRISTGGGFREKISEHKVPSPFAQ